MSEIYYFSAVNNSFYFGSMESSYGDSWPHDLIEASTETFNEFVAPRAGKIRIVGNDGMPAWGDLPALTPEQVIASARATQQELINNANVITADWRTELALDIISDDDKVSLTAWMQYIKAVKAVDVTQLPVTFPDPPK